MQETKKKRNKKSKVPGWVIPALITICMFVGGAIGVKKMMKTDDVKRRRQIQMIKVLEPKAPPEIEEKIPEPEEIKEINQEVQEIAQEQFVEDTVSEASADEAPPGQDLGLDADGAAGSDGFGLVGKKGGRALLGSGQGGMGNSLLGRYGWYVQKVQEMIRENLLNELERDGGIPDGNLEAVVRIVLDETGRITDFKIIGSSGSHKMDNALNIALKQIDIETALPDEMPKSLKIKVSSKG